jgi:hypothetical protein
VTERNGGDEGALEGGRSAAGLAVEAVGAVRA